MKPVALICCDKKVYLGSKSSRVWMAVRPIRCVEFVIGHDLDLAPCPINPIAICGELIRIAVWVELVIEIRHQPHDLPFLICS